MSARMLIVLWALVKLINIIMLFIIESHQRKKRLPAEVSDIYDADRYKTYLAYETDNRKSCIVSLAINLAFLVFFSFSNVFTWIEGVSGGNPYLIYLLTFGIFETIEIIIDSIEDYFDTFFIKEKYGLNKAGKREFFKDRALEILEDMITSIGFGMVVIVIGENLSNWTNNFSFKSENGTLLGLGIILIVVLFALVAALISLLFMRKKYCFVPLPDGPLRSKIMELQKNSGKKVYRISVYDESKKTNSKNAFLLRFFGYREFGIADNFINENSEEELLAVLSHEIGHLNHKRNVIDFISFVVSAGIIYGFASLLNYPQIILKVNAWIRSSFGITTNNYYIWLCAAPILIEPVIKLWELLQNYRSRREESEADLEAVKNGYGPALISTFKRLSDDELVDVYPHPLVEFLEYKHPSMYHRIKNMQDAEKKQKDVIF